MSNAPDFHLKCGNKRVAKMFLAGDHVLWIYTNETMSLTINLYGSENFDGFVTFLSNFTRQNIDDHYRYKTDLFEVYREEATHGSNYVCLTFSAGGLWFSLSASLKSYLALAEYLKAEHKKIETRRVQAD